MKSRMKESSALRGTLMYPVLILLISTAGLHPLCGQNRSIEAAAVSGPPYLSDTDWKQIVTPYHRLIFPDGYEEHARRVAEIGERTWGLVQEDLEVEVPPYPLVLNTGNRLANGYFALAPRRSEWYAYTSQGQFAGPSDWYTLLALHEGRHAAQFSALNRGATRVGRYIAGQYGWSFLSMYSVPLWFFEGDAIMSETMFSSSGRGRSAAFHREIRAIVEEGVDASYSQAYLGSYRLHFPNHYYLGFPLVSYVRLEYGEDAWNEILRKTSNWSFVPLRFHTAMKRVTGRSVPEVYRDALYYYSGYFEDQKDPGAHERPRKNLSDSDVEYYDALPSSGWTNYLPVGVEGGLYALRYGDEFAPALVQVSSEAEADFILHLPTSGRPVSVAAGRAVWAEQAPHPLRSKVSYSEIVRCDLETGRREVITEKGSFQAPALSPDGRKIAAVKALPGGGAKLEILSAETGGAESALTEKITAAGGSREPVDRSAPQGGADLFGARGNAGPSFILHPAWSADGRRLAVVEVEAGKSVIAEYRLPDMEKRVLIGPVRETISSPVYYGEYVLYVSEASGKEAIEAVHRESGKRYRVVSGAFAVKNPVVRRAVSTSDSGAASASASVTGHDLLYFADYGAGGFRLARLELDPENFAPVGKRQWPAVDYFEPVAARHGKAPDLWRSGSQYDGPEAGAEERKSREDERETYEVKDYRPAAHFLNVHSWGIVPDGTGRMQAFLQSDDVLGLMSLQTFAGFNPREDSCDAGFQGVYRGMYPVLRFGFAGDTHHPSDPERRWDGISGILGFDAPVDLSRGIWNRNLLLETTAFLRWEESEPDSLDDASGESADFALPVRHSASFYRSSKAMVPADFAPPREQYLEAGFVYMPLPADPEGETLFSRALFTFPGALKRHRLQLTAEAEWSYGEEVPVGFLPVRPRGYPPDWSENYEGKVLAGVQYGFPLWYPDAAIGSLYFLKRMRANLFTELSAAAPGGAELPDGISTDRIPGYLEGWEKTVDADVHPVSGIELLFEQHLFSLPIAFEAGLRVLYRWRDETVRLEDTVFTLGAEW